MIKIPQARAKAAEASFPTLVELGKECFNMRRTQASGGSNSTAECNFLLLSSFGVAVIAAADSPVIVMVGVLKE